MPCKSSSSFATRSDTQAPEQEHQEDRRRICTQKGEVVSKSFSYMLSAAALSQPRSHSQRSHGHQRNLLGNVANTSSHDSQPKTDRSSLLAQAKSTKVGLAKTWRGVTRFADARPGEAQPRGTSHRTLELQCIDFFLERGDTAISCELLLQRAICPQSRHPIPSISSAMLKRQRTPSTRMKTFFSSLDQSQASSKGSTITGSCS